MKKFTLCLLACACLSSAFGLQDAPARGAARGSVPPLAFASARSKVPVAKRGPTHKPAGSSSKAKKHEHAAKTNTRRTRSVLVKASARDIALVRQAVANEISERGARADRLYAASQLSAPIILDAKACRRTGTNGESIYENC